MHAGSLEALRVTRPEAVDLECINNKYVKINVRGYASPPGTYNHNSDKSNERAQFVVDHLVRSFGSGSVEINSDAVANIFAKEIPGVRPDQRDKVYRSDRKVEVKIDKDEAARGVRRVMTEAGFRVRKK
jgi:hypothetical protein